MSEIPDQTQAQASPNDMMDEKRRPVEQTALPEDDAMDQNQPTITRTVSGPPYSIFSPSAKLSIVFMVAISALISPFAATMFYPALNVLAAQLNVSESLITLSITTYMLAQAIAPAFIAGISDQSGRRLSFIICFVVYTVANIGLALQTSYAALLVLRFVQASGSSATIALAIAVVADISTSAERGRFMGYATSGILIGPAFGPVIGGGLADSLGWRSIFWFLVIFGAVLCVVFSLFFPETCRNVVGNGSIPARGVNRSLLGSWQQRKYATDIEAQEQGEQKDKKKKGGFIWPNPLTTLVILKEKESAILLVYNGLFFYGYMALGASMPYMLKTYYGYDELKVGLCFIPLGGGSLASALVMGRVVDWNFRRHAAKVGMTIAKGKQQDITDYPIELARLQVVAPAHLVGTIFLIIFGWLIKYVVHIVGPLFALFFIGGGISTAFNTSNTLLIDLHRGKPASATSAVNFVRCLISAGGIAAIVPMIEAWNPGWTYTFLGLLYVAVMPMLWVLVKWGPKWRAEVREKKLRKEEEKNMRATEAARHDENAPAVEIPTQSDEEAKEMEAKI